MPGKEDIINSILVVSGSEQFDSIVKRSLTPSLEAEFKKSAATARRSILERCYDLVIINVPLRDESGEQLAFDVVHQCSASVLLVAPSEIYEAVLDSVTDSGILVIPKPFPRGRLDKGIRFLSAVQERIRMLERKVQTAQERLEELRIVDKAKFYLIERNHMTEDEAHRLIVKQAMDNGATRRRIASKILEEFEEM